MTKKTLSIFVVALVCISFYGGIKLFAERSSDGYSIENARQRLLYFVGIILEKGHYEPKAIDDKLSERIFVRYLNALDGSYDIFLMEDIQTLDEYKTLLDDEMTNQHAFEFIPLVSDLFDKRISEVDTLRKKILAQPFDYLKDESYISPNTLNRRYVDLGDLNQDANDVEELLNLDFPSSLEERIQRWRKKLKRDCIGGYYRLRETELDKRKDTSYKVWKSFDSLEFESRQNIARRYDRFFNRIYKHFDEEARFDAYLNTFMNIMDPHSAYLSPIDTRSYEESTSGKFYGIGALLTLDGKYVKIVNVSPGGAAWKSKQISPNDLILKVGQGLEDSAVDLIGYETTEAVKLIRGDKGTQVRLTIQKTDGTIKEVILTRDKIFINQTFARSGIIPYNDKKIGYIYLPEFYNSVEPDAPENPQSSVDVKAELIKLQEQRVEGIVLDLRNNGGGYLLDAIKMAGWFIPKGPVVQVKSKGEEAYALNDVDTSVVYDGPLVILLNEYSASASEIFAAAMQDYGRALVVGARSSFGKGTVQKGGLAINYFFNESKDLGTLNLTIQKFYRISGMSTQLKGVVSDIVLPSVNDFLPVREKDLPYALRYDSVARADFQSYNPTKYDYLNISKNMKALICKSDYYNKIKSYGEYLHDLRNKPTPLNLKVYKNQLSKRKEYTDAIDSMVKKMDTLNVQIMKTDSIRYAKMDSTESTLFLSWYKGLNKDITLTHTVDILYRMMHKEYTPLSTYMSDNKLRKKWFLENK